MRLGRRVARFVTRGRRGSRTPEPTVAPRRGAGRAGRRGVLSEAAHRRGRDDAVGRGSGDEVVRDEREEEAKEIRGSCLTLKLFRTLSRVFSKSRTLPALL